MTRREMIKACAATMALRAIGSAWPIASVSAAGRAAGALWVNKHENLSARVSSHFDVWNDRSSDPEVWRTGCAKLRDILEAAETAGHRVRAVGSRWALSPVAVCPDVMINTLPLNCHSVGIPAEHVSSTGVDPVRLVFAQCGTGIAELNRTLELDYGLSLPTSGASNGQTICGAISTGTHGSARRVGAMQDFMLGLHVLTGNGRQFWIERASKPVVSDAFCHHLGATLVRDDRLFRSAVVGLGSFGIIHAVMFEASPIYLLEVRRKRMDWPDVAHAAATLDTAELGLSRFDDAHGEPFHFDVALNPYRTRRGQHGAVVTAMYKRPYRELPGRRSMDGKLVPGVDLLGIVGKLATAVPATIPWGVSAMFDGMVRSSGESVVGTHGSVFDDTELVGKSLSAEIAVDLADAGAAAETLLDVAKRYPYPGMFGFRYVQKSDALLAFTRFDTTCAIELTGAGSSRTLNFYDRAWAALDARRIPYALHWGKVHNINCDNIRDRWPGAVDEWLSARRSFLDAGSRRMFSNDLLTACKLNA